MPVETNDIPRRQVRICYAGTYEREYPRNQLVIRALRQAGTHVEEAHVPVFERQRDKSRPVRTAASLLHRLAFAYLRLVPEIALRMLRCDALMIGYIGQADMLVLAPVAKLTRRPVIFNPLVTLTDTLIDDRRLVRDGSVPARLIALLDRVTLALADIVLVDTEENGRYAVERLGAAPEKLVVVPVGADETMFAPGAERSQSKTLDVLFYGKFIPLHGIETILHAAALLEARGAPFQLELVGTGQTYEAMRALANQLGLHSVVWTDWIPFAALGARLRGADIALGVFDSGAKAGRVVPNKVYQSLAAGVATVTRDSPAMRRLVTDGESALLVPPDDPAVLASAIERLADPTLRARIATSGLTAYQERGSISAMANSLAPVIDVIRERRWPRDRD